MKEIRIGIIGLDTSHVIRFTEILNNAKDPYHVEGGKIIAAFPGGSEDLKASWSRLGGFRKELEEKWKIKMVDNISDLTKEVDAILLESVDGRKHLPQFKECINAGAKVPVFIDKPLAANLNDAREIFRLAKKEEIPVFSSSSLRFDINITKALSKTQEGRVLGCEACSPAPLEPTNPGFYWYGIHGCEILYTAMGPGCQRVWCIGNKDYDLAVGLWKDGRVGTMRGIRKGEGWVYGCTLYREKGIKRVTASSTIPFYARLLEEIIKFFHTGKPPINPEETLEIMAFIDAANRSKENEGRGEPLTLEKN